MQFSLQKMVEATVAEAEERIKLAQAEEKAEATSEGKEKKKSPPAETPPDNTATKPERNDETMMSAEGEKTSSVLVEKLASACEYLNKEFWKEAAAPEGTTIGPGMGPNTLPLNEPTPGKQSENTGQAAGANQPPMKPGADPKAEGQTNPDTALETDINAPPGGSEDWSKGPDKMKQAAKIRDILRKKAGVDPRVARVLGVMDKMAADAESPAKIQGKHSDAPPDATQAEEGVPAQPSETSKQESMVGSNQSAINFTKQQAKAVPKKRMSEVLGEPAQKKSTDPVLHENLDATSGAGVKLSSATKVAAARALLHKIAAEGASPDATPEQKAKAEQLKTALGAKKKEEEEGGGGEGEEKQAQGEGDAPLGGGY